MGPTNIPLKSSKTSVSPLLSALPVVGGLLSSLVGSRQQRKADERTFSHNKEMAQYAYSKDLEMWNLSNQYNDPSNQMSRLKGAGLNPNLVYGTGSVSGNTSGQLPKYNAPTANFKKGQTPDFQGMLGQYHNIAQTKAQINLTNQQAIATNEQAKNTYVDTLNKGRTGKLKDQDFRNIEAKFPHQLQAIMEDNKQRKNQQGKTLQEIKNLKGKDVQQKELNRLLIEEGINPNDPSWYRDAKKSGAFEAIKWLVDKIGNPMGLSTVPWKK